MITISADARPEKRFFLEMFIRDLTLEDCILDLIDNSIDSLIRSRDIDVSEALLGDTQKTLTSSNTGGHIEPGSIKIDYSAKHFQIVDTCGGISIEDAKSEVFHFGHSPDVSPSQLGVYGIGLKRAIFKIGNQITIESKTEKGGFRMNINVPSWADDRFNWTLPLEVIDGTAGLSSAGTSIIISDFRREVSERFRAGSFEKILHDMIAETYSLFLNRYVIIMLNGHKVDPVRIPLGSSEHANVAKEVFQHDDVSVTLYASLAPRDADGRWRMEDAGWYAACNGRFVVTRDKTDLTGWGSPYGPIFVPKYRGFVGIAFFYSKNPFALPWTTTKRGLNRDSLVFQVARGRMANVARPILRFLDNMYAAEEMERAPQRRIAEGIQAVDVRRLADNPAERFTSTALPPGEITVKVQYDAKNRELDRVRKHLRKSGWPAKKIGRFTFEHYLKTECPE